MTNRLDGVAPLTHLGLIRAQGEDAAKFLHNQFTNDFVLLGQAEARLAGFCSAKGRLQASFIGFKRDPNDLLLVCSKDILATTLKRLSLFVLRAKVRLSDASDDFQLFGLAGDAVAVAVASKNISDSPENAWAKADFDDATLIHLYPADGVARALWVAPKGSATPAGAPMAPELWAWSEVRSGVATVSAPIVDAFVPQMLNYESVGGVHFKKGCYPGQEVVARSQFRGTLKRRAYLAHAEVEMQAGADVFVAGDDQPCGTVAQAAPAPAGGFEAIVSMQISAFGGGKVRLASADGPELRLSAPPYPLRDDI